MFHKFKAMRFAPLRPLQLRKHFLRPSGHCRTLV